MAIGSTENLFVAILYTLPPEKIPWPKIYQINRFAQGHEMDRFLAC